MRIENKLVVLGLLTLVLGLAVVARGSNGAIVTIAGAGYIIVLLGSTCCILAVSGRIAPSPHIGERVSVSEVVRLEHVYRQKVITEWFSPCWANEGHSSPFDEQPYAWRVIDERELLGELNASKLKVGDELVREKRGYGSPERKPTFRTPSA